MEDFREVLNNVDCFFLKEIDRMTIIESNKETFNL